ncbi:MAG: thioesterase family protein [Bacteroidales bacterium]
METQLSAGLKNTIERTVEKQDTAAAYGSGLVEVYATPAMIALMEQTALQTVSGYLPEGYNTVGTHVNIKHLKATPVGMKVFCKAELLEVDGNKLKFLVEAFDEEGKIGTGEHKRFIIDDQRFMKQMNRK